MIFLKYNNDWENKILLDSEVTLFIKKSEFKDRSEFYKIYSVDGKVQYSSIIKLGDNENREIKEKITNKQINKDVYLNLWKELIFDVTPPIKSIYLYSSDEPQSYLFNFRVLENRKKTSGIGNIFQLNLKKFYYFFKKINDN